jgi:hypothetical protein
VEECSKAFEGGGGSGAVIVRSAIDQQSSGTRTAP